MIIEGVSAKVSAGLEFIDGGLQFPPQIRHVSQETFVFQIKQRGGPDDRYANTMNSKQRNK